MKSVRNLRILLEIGSKQALLLLVVPFIQQHDQSTPGSATQASATKDRGLLHHGDGHRQWFINFLST
ncbi:hypothetical protein C7476_10188 [Phyllobacterium bourgognense]|uniref:Uncharacterized protein n=1 Tax=Phyllobacterium bourgognense TaxID=314236 RepID=A0A368Z841_9HYPH|nr:hypothetical protein C7476_10188 [Phyllobacterium bourgognense]